MQGLNIKLKKKKINLFLQGHDFFFKKKSYKGKIYCLVTKQVTTCDGFTLHRCCYRYIAIEANAFLIYFTIKKENGERRMRRGSALKIEV